MHVEAHLPPQLWRCEVQVCMQVEPWQAATHLWYVCLHVAAHVAAWVRQLADGTHAPESPTESTAETSLPGVPESVLPASLPGFGECASGWAVPPSSPPASAGS